MVPSHKPSRETTTDSTTKSAGWRVSSRPTFLPVITPSGWEPPSRDTTCRDNLPPLKKVRLNSGAAFVPSRDDRSLPKNSGDQTHQPTNKDKTDVSAAEPANLSIDHLDLAFSKLTLDSGHDQSSSPSIFFFQKHAVPIENKSSSVRQKASNAQRRRHKELLYPSFSWFSPLCGSINPEKEERAWLLDSGATCHTCSNWAWFHTIDFRAKGNLITASESSTDKYEGVGGIVLKYKKPDGTQSVLLLHRVIYTPHVANQHKSNIISPGALLEPLSGVSIYYTRSDMSILHNTARGTEKLLVAPVYRKRPWLTETSPLTYSTALDFDMLPYYKRSLKLTLEIWQKVLDDGRKVGLRKAYDTNLSKRLNERNMDTKDTKIQNSSVPKKTEETENIKESQPSQSR